MCVAEQKGNLPPTNYYAIKACLEVLVRHARSLLTGFIWISLVPRSKEEEEEEEEEKEPGFSHSIMCLILSICPSVGGC